MICYLDMTFCSFYKECNRGNKCSRALTDEVKNKANVLDLPICQFMNKPDCLERLENEKDERW